MLQDLGEMWRKLVKKYYDLYPQVRFCRQSMSSSLVSAHDTGLQSSGFRSLAGGAMHSRVELYATKPGMIEPFWVE